ncbi:MAG TPA: SRPBCC family protein [Terriglobales bacterium]|nr:SRPBCC family protein [Terriglobales bacterium]
MKQRHFWTGVAVGAAAAAGSAWLVGLLGRGGRSRIIRIEKSIQIGRPVEDVFQTWCELETLPRYTNLLRSVRRSGNHSFWVAEVGGIPLEWDAEIAQVIPNESIGWRSVEGVRHSGRVTFSTIGDQTLVHVQMNYAPKLWFLRPVLSPAVGMLEGYIEQALRDVKSALESCSGKTASKNEPHAPTQATGTYGPTGENPRFGTATIPVEFTAPPESKR